MDLRDNRPDSINKGPPDYGPEEEHPLLKRMKTAVRRDPKARRWPTEVKSELAHDALRCLLEQQEGVMPETISDEEIVRVVSCCAADAQEQYQNHIKFTAERRYLKAKPGHTIEPVGPAGTLEEVKKDFSAEQLEELVNYRWAVMERVRLFYPVYFAYWVARDWDPTKKVPGKANKGKQYKRAVHALLNCMRMEAATRALSKNPLKKLYRHLLRIFEPMQRIEPKRRGEKTTRAMNTTALGKLIARLFKALEELARFT